MGAFRPPTVYSVTIEAGKKLGGISQDELEKKSKLAPHKKVKEEPKKEKPKEKKEEPKKKVETKAPDDAESVFGKGNTNSQTEGHTQTNTEAQESEAKGDSKTYSQAEAQAEEVNRFRDRQAFTESRFSVIRELQLMLGERALVREDLVVKALVAGSSFLRRFVAILSY